MKYKALFLDIDDTLIGEDKTVSKGNLEAIQKAREAGAFVTLATGRGYLGALKIINAVQVKGQVVVYGGACIADSRNGEIIYTAEISSNLITEALNFSKELGLVSQIYQGDRVIVEKDNENSSRYVSVLCLPYTIEPRIREIEWQNVPKVLVFAPIEREMEFVQKFSAHFKGRLEIASSKPGYIELNRLGSNKGAAMLYVADMLGIKQEEIIAVGDNTLDLQMIQMAGLGVCVENGQQIVKDHADVIAPSCERDGVKWVIENYIL